jgi:hypothetical protein
MHEAIRGQYCDRKVQPVTLIALSEAALAAAIHWGPGKASGPR